LYGYATASSGRIHNDVTGSKNTTGIISRKSNETGRNPKDGVSRFTAKTADLKRATEKKATEKTAMKNWATGKLGSWKTRQQKNKRVGKKATKN